MSDVERVAMGHIRAVGWRRPFVAVQMVCAGVLVGWVALCLLAASPVAALSAPSAYPYAPLTQGSLSGVLGYKLTNTTTQTVYLAIWQPNGNTLMSIWVPTVAGNKIASARVVKSANQPGRVVRSEGVWAVGAWNSSASRWDCAGTMQVWRCVYSGSVSWSPYSYVWGKNVYGSGWSQVPIRTSTTYIGQEYSYTAAASNVPSYIQSLPYYRSLSAEGVSTAAEWSWLVVAVNPGQTAVFYPAVWDRGKSYYDLREVRLTVQTSYDWQGNPVYSVSDNLRGVPNEYDYNTKQLLECYPRYLWSEATLTVSVLKDGRTVATVVPERLSFGQSVSTDAFIEGEWVEQARPVITTEVATVTVSNATTGTAVDLVSFGTRLLGVGEWLRGLVAGLLAKLGVSL